MKTSVGGGGSGVLAVGRVGAAEEVMKGGQWGDEEWVKVG